MDEPVVSLLFKLNKYLATAFTLNTFQITGLFLHPLLMFSGGIVRDQWHEMGY